MRLIRWVEGRISGRKSRQKDGSTTSVDDQFVYHPSPFRQQLSHIATPAHNPPKLHHQLEQRLNDQIKERLSGHFTHLNSKLNNKQQSVQLRRTASALESRSKPRKLFNRTSEYNQIDKHISYDSYALPDKIFENEYEHTYESNNSFERNFINENQNPANYQSRYSSITQASNESAFFDFSSPSLATQECHSPSLGKLFLLCSNFLCMFDVAFLMIFI